eukprot:276436-Prymnesium_polylepis.1
MPAATHPLGSADHSCAASPPASLAGAHTVRQPSLSTTNATDDCAAARDPVAATSGIALSTATFKAASAIPHTCRRRQPPSGRRSYRPALGADPSRLNLRLKMHRHVRSTTWASSNDTHNVCA